MEHTELSFIPKMLIDARISAIQKIDLAFIFIESKKRHFYFTIDVTVKNEILLQRKFISLQ